MPAAPKPAESMDHADEQARNELHRGIALARIGEHEDAKQEFASAWHRSSPDSDLRVLAVYHIIGSEICQGHTSEARAMLEVMRPAVEVAAEVLRLAAAAERAVEAAEVPS